MKKTGLGILLFFVALAMNSVVASAQKNQPSEKVVNFLTKLAFAQIPEKIKNKKTGKMIQLNKKKVKGIIIPVADMRRVIKVGYVSGQAQLCGLEPYMIANYQAMMRAEHRRKKWSPAQLVFINKLHLTTVLMTTGQIKVKLGELTDKERDKAKREIARGLKKKLEKKNCPKKFVRELKKNIENFVDANKS